MKKLEVICNLCEVFADSTIGRDEAACLEAQLVHLPECDYLLYTVVELRRAHERGDNPFPYEVEVRKGMGDLGLFKAKE